MIKKLRKIRKLQKDQEGTALVEFAIVAPVFLFLLIGTFDLGYTIYMKSVLSGAMQKAARDAALETGPGTLDAIDEYVEDQVGSVAINGTFSFERKSYYEFTDVDRAESFSDDDGDGVCNNGESFEDENDNGSWDENLGADGVGGPKDVVLYTVNIDYTPLLPIYNFIGLDPHRRISGSTILKNQPYGEQDERPVITSGTCT